MDRNDYIEKVIGGILGGIAIIAAFVEAAMAGFSVDAIVSAVKDIAGTAVVLILLVAFINEHKKAKGIRGSIERAMEKLEGGYSPLIREAFATETAGDAKKAKLERTVRYEIAVNTDALFATQCNNYCPFFDVDLDAPTSVDFYIRKKFFRDTPEAPFDAEAIFNKISQYMVRQHKNLSIEFKSDPSGGKATIRFQNSIKYEKDINDLISIVDDMIFAYTVIQHK